MPDADLVIRGRQVVTPQALEPASIHIRNGIIVALGAYEDAPAGGDVFDAGASVVMPGLVDSHVHVNEPGRTEWEGFATATRAAAVGGVTTIIDMPLNSIPPTTTLAGLHTKIAATEGRRFVDVGFWGGVVPGNVSELEPMHEAGVAGFKCFLVPSGVAEFEHVTEESLRPAMSELARIGTTLIAHAETPGPIEHALKQHAQAAWGDPRRYETFLSSRPCAAENEAVALLIKLCRETGARTHVVHHSSADALSALAGAKAEGLPLTVETCPHYLVFAAEDIPDGATEFKCCPPVRERENREQLWAALADGVIDMVVSDHSPCPPEMKLREEGDFLKAWGGISSLQLRLPVMWTAARARGFDLVALARWLCAAPAQLAGLAGRKGAIAVGCDADLVIWPPDASFRVTPSMIEHRHKLTPYAGMEFSGVVEATYLRGERIHGAGALAAGARGGVVKRN
jgi:allantoinase